MAACQFYRFPLLELLQADRAGLALVLRCLRLRQLLSTAFYQRLVAIIHPSYHGVYPTLKVIRSRHQISTLFSPLRALVTQKYSDN